MFTFIQRMIDDAFNRGVETGIAQQKLEQLEDANRRQEYLFDEGKRLGYEKGSFDGFTKGYTKGLEDGKVAGYQDAKAEVGEIDIDDLEVMA